MSNSITGNLIAETLNSLKNKGESYCIYGAGKLTRKLLSFIDEKQLLRPLFIIDDSNCGSLRSIDILPMQIKGLSMVDHVLLGSDYHQKSMTEKLESFGSYSIIDLFNLSSRQSVLFEGTNSETLQSVLSEYSNVTREQRRHTDLTLIKEAFQSCCLQFDSLEIDEERYKHYMKESNYEYNYPVYSKEFRGHLLSVKSLQHFLSLELLGVSAEHSWIDIASSNSCFPDILQKQFGVKTCWRQDWSYNKGIVGERIGSDAVTLPLSGQSIDRISLHCSWEHFEADKDIEFLHEVHRVLRPGGKICIVPLYMANDYVIETSPEIWLNKYWNVDDLPIFDGQARININNTAKQRHSKFYSVDILEQKLAPLRGIFNIAIYHFNNASKIDGAPHFSLFLERI